MGNKSDDIIPLDQVWEHLKRIIKPNGAIVLTAQTPFDKVLGASNLPMLKYEWIWEKTTATGHLNAKHTRTNRGPGKGLWLWVLEWDADSGKSPTLNEALALIKSRHQKSGED